MVDIVLLDVRLLAWQQLESELELGLVVALGLALICLENIVHLISLVLNRMCNNNYTDRRLCIYLPRWVA